MKTDRLTKLLLAAIATALWIIALNPWLHPIPVAAQSESYLRSIRADVSSIQSDVNAIWGGICINGKIC